MRSALFLASLLLLLPLSGCFGADDSSKQAAPIEEDPNALPEGVTNILQGRVLGSDEGPIADVTVELISLNATNATNELGEYRFMNLEPRDYLVVASKEGYRTVTQRAIVEEGNIYELNFLLVERPNIVPYDELHIFKGFISCQFAYGTNPENQQRQDCGTADPNNNQAKEFTLGVNAAQVQIEAVWTKKSDAAKELSMTVESVGFGHQDIIFGQDNGETGMKMVVSQSLVQKYYPLGGQLRISMAAAASLFGDEAAADGGLALQQDFTLYVSIFYVEPGPNSYSAVPK